MRPRSWIDGAIKQVARRAEVKAEQTPSLIASGAILLATVCKSESDAAIIGVIDAHLFRLAVTVAIEALILLVEIDALHCRVSA